MAELVNAISVREILADPELGLSVVSSAGLAGQDARIAHNRVQRVGLALAGHFYGVVPRRIQVCGATEISYLHALAPSQRERVLLDFFALGVCCVVVTGGLSVPQELVQTAELTATTVVIVREKTGMAIQAIENLLDDRLAPRTQLHGVLVDVFGVGMLLVGKSGIGKSECALDLVMRGHRLVADDIVVCEFRPPGQVFGAAAGLLRYHIEVRGLGVLNVKTLFGVTAVRDRKRIDVVARLWSGADEPEHDPLGVEDRYFEMLGVRIREIVLPVRAGRDMASIIEIAARDELSRRAGHHSAREFFDTIERSLREGANDESIATMNPYVFDKGST